MIETVMHADTVAPATSSYTGKSAKQIDAEEEEEEEKNANNIQTNERKTQK